MARTRHPSDSGDYGLNDPEYERQFMHGNADEDSPDDGEDTSEDSSDFRSTDTEDYRAADREAYLDDDADPASVSWAQQTTDTLGTFQCICCGERSPFEVPHRLVTHGDNACGHSIHVYCAEVASVPIHCVCREGVIDSSVQAPPTLNRGEAHDAGEGSSSSAQSTQSTQSTRSGNQCVFCGGLIDEWVPYGTVTHHDVACGYFFHFDCAGIATEAVPCLCGTGRIDFIPLPRPRQTT